MTKVRELFPCTRQLAYLNTATFGPGPTPVVDAVEKSLAEWSEGTGHWRDFELAGETSRELFARLLRVEPETVSLQPTLAAGAAQAAADLANPSGGRDRIVVGAGEFRSNLYPWLAQRERGFDVQILPWDAGRPLVEALETLVDDRTALVAISTVQSSNGFRAPVARIGELCRAAGARLFLDATQSVGALDLDLTGADYVGVSNYKWLFAPRGTAFLRLSPERLEHSRPIAPNWKSPDDPYADYYGLPYDLAPRASRLDTTLAWHSWIGAAEGLKLLHEVGIGTIESHGLELAARFRRGLAAIGRQPLFAEAESSHIVGLHVSDPRGVQRTLDARGVVAAVRGEYLRVSFALFNDESDVDRALDALEAAEG